MGKRRRKGWMCTMNFWLRQLGTLEFWETLLDSFGNLGPIAPITLAVADNFDERIEQKIFHCEIVVDNEKVKAETARYKKIPPSSTSTFMPCLCTISTIFRRSEHMP